MPRVTGRAATPILVRVFGALGGALCAVAIVLGALRARELSTYDRTDGVVIAFSTSGRSYRPVVAFRDSAGRYVRFTSPIGSRPPAFRVGEQVGVRYSPAHPSEGACIDSFMQLWFFPFLFGVIGGPFLLASGLVGMRGRRQTE